MGQRRTGRHGRRRPLRPRPGGHRTRPAGRAGGQRRPPGRQPARARMGRQRPRGSRPRHPRPPRGGRRPPDRPAHRHQHRHVHPTVNHRLPGVVRTHRPGTGLRGLPGARPVCRRRRRRPLTRPTRPARRRLRALRPQRHRPARRRPPLRPAGPGRPAAGLLQREHRLRRNRTAHHHPVPQTAPDRHRRGAVAHRRDRGRRTGTPGAAGDADRADHQDVLATPPAPHDRQRAAHPGQGRGLGRVVEVPPAPRRLARTLAALSESSEQAHYEDDPPPCNRTHQTPRGPPCGRTALLPKHGLEPSLRIAEVATGCFVCTLRNPAARVCHNATASFL
ncbi:hypothetical protein SBRY_50601 [Actinacidiphila bryophytorum]|uniref:Uncharacterized protein n=1 Tax=Actinacidiphila bryophytorum TaxID=1436133 RepID=A0A9W4H517_9ACTN|nr:hypothetical protein SBRY_50601 [Actinacidiphila bryophytorum]